MGSRSITYYSCPKKCGGMVEEYDAPTSLLFVAICDKCHWQDPRYYIEYKSEDGWVFQLITPIEDP